MAEWIGIGRRGRRCYGFDEIALVPGAQTVNPEEVDTSFEIDGNKFKIPILAAAMDGVVDVKFAVEMSKLGGIAVLNLDGIQTRYENPDSVLEQIAKATAQKATELTQSVYTNWRTLTPKRIHIYLLLFPFLSSFSFVILSFK